jgi:ribosomal protein S18 acetylase RimI-like enzyme
VGSTVDDRQDLQLANAHTRQRTLRAVSDVRRATRADIPAMSTALASAFSDDPVMAWVLGPNPSADRLRRMFASMLKSWYLKREETWTTDAGDGIPGAAIWTPPGQWRQTLLETLAVAPTMIRLVGRRLGVAGRGFQMIEKHHLKEPHYYLAVLGTATTRQGKGHGSAMLEPVLDRCDTEGALAYLESSKEQNIPFYERHGFVVQEELQLPDGPPLWPMLREPRPR